MKSNLIHITFFPKNQIVHTSWSDCIAEEIKQGYSYLLFFATIFSTSSLRTEVPLPVVIFHSALLILLLLVVYYIRVNIFH